MKYTDLEQTDNFSHLCIHGESGTGKSTLASQLAFNHKLIWISCDLGHRVLSKLPLAAKQNIDIIVIRDTRDAPVARDTVSTLLKGKPTTVCQMHGVVNCSVCRRHNLEFSSYEFNKNPPGTIVVLDHLTRLTDSTMAQICLKQAVDYKPKLDDWGSLRFQLASMMGDVQAARYDIVCIAQSMMAEDEAGSKKLVPSVGSYEFGRMVNQFFDHIVYAEVVNGTHRFGSATTYSHRAASKSRTDVKIEDMKVPSLEPFFSTEGRIARETSIPEVALADMVINNKTAAQVVEEQAPPTTASSLERLKALAKAKGK
jgi:DNA polymerase III delta prime subunit